MNSKSKVIGRKAILWHAQQHVNFPFKIWNNSMDPVIVANTGRTIYR